MEQENDKEPVKFLFFKGWPSIYAFVIFILAVCISFFYWITLSFS